MSIGFRRAELGGGQGVYSNRRGREAKLKQALTLLQSEASLPQSKIAALMRFINWFQILRSRLFGLMILLFPVAVQAQFTFVTNSGAITITGYTGSGGNVTIPSTTNGYPVTTIGASAFNHQGTLTNLTIPNSVTSIGDHAFEFCSGLTNLTTVPFASEWSNES